MNTVKWLAAIGISFIIGGGVLVFTSSQPSRVTVADSSDMLSGDVLSGDVLSGDVLSLETVRLVTTEELSAQRITPTSTIPPTLPTPVAITPTSRTSTLPLPQTLSGRVISEDEPLANAIVQVQGIATTTQTDAKGNFTLAGLDGMMPVNIMAWAEGYYIGWVALDPESDDWQGGENISITLNPIPMNDYSKYAGFSFEGVQGSAACGLCHREYQEWRSDAHSRAATNPRFVTMYTGTNVNGEEGQYTEFNAQGLPKPLDPTKPHFGPGFILDNSGRIGNCATCHTPLASNAPNTQNCSWLGCHTSLTIERANGIIAPQAKMPQFLTGDAADGVTCEFCHKIGDVIINPETGLPKPDMPGILSYRLHRPADESQQIFFGTLIDVARQDTYLPLQSEGAFCAGCHFGVFGGVVGMGEVAEGTLVYNSFGEWLESPYSDPDTGTTCQECHMPKSDSDWFVFPERGGISRDYAYLNNHTMRGIDDLEFMQNAVTLTANADFADDGLQVRVDITNDNTGHHIPTDAPIRSMILVVEVFDANGTALPLLDGSVNPEYSGEYGGVAGKTFAKVLRDEWTGETPTGAYWRPVSIVEDTRLVALATDSTRYTFEMPSGQSSGDTLTVKVRLLFRRAFTALAQQKGWEDADVLMEEVIVKIAAN